MPHLTFDHQPTQLPTIVYGLDSHQFSSYINQIYPPSLYLTYPLTPSSTSIGIDQIHQLQTKLAITANQPRLVWIQQAHLLTQPAQNSLLKLLEEPPQNTYFVLTTTHLKQLLPTLISRCQLHHLTQTNQTINSEILQQLKSFLSQNPGERLAQLKQIPTKRDEALVWFDQLITSLDLARQQTQNLHQLTIFKKIIQPAIQAKQHLQANLNPTLAIEHFLLSLPKTK